jgi:septum formation protein
MPNPLAPFHIILASGSPRRRQLLGETGCSIAVKISNADELEGNFSTIAETAVTNAQVKGRAVRDRLTADDRVKEKRNVLLAADTMVGLGHRTYGKPVDLDQAKQFLRELAQQPHKVITGVYLYDLDNKKEFSFFDTTTVTLKAMDNTQLDDLFTRMNPLDKAGAYGYQQAPDIVTHMEGSETNVIGLPMEKLMAQLVEIQ